MIIMKKSIPYNYTYESFLEDFNIDLKILDLFNDTTPEKLKKKLSTSLSRERISRIESKKNLKINDQFEAIFHLENVRGKEKTLKMDFLYNGEYLFQNVSGQTFIFITGIILNTRFSKRYDYNTINEWYKSMRQRNDRYKGINSFSVILNELKTVADEL